MWALLLACAVDVLNRSEPDDTARTVGACGAIDRAPAILTFVGAERGDLGGAVVAGAHDVNGDGCDDVILGSLPGAAVASVALGGAELGAGSLGDVDPTFALGDAVRAAGVGDVDGDGYADLLLHCGDEAACLLAGRAELTAADLQTPVARYPGDFALAAAGDVDGDGRADLLLGEGTAVHLVAGTSVTFAGDAGIGLGDLDADGFDEIGISGGGIGVVRGSAELTESPDVVIDCGSLAGPAGDVDGDGFADVLASSSGAAYLFRGGTAIGDRTCDDAAGVYLGGAAVPDAGATVAGAGDVNADGFGDVVVGTVASGRVYLFLGRSEVGVVDVAQADARFDIPPGRSGTPLAAAGDVDADGFADFLIGAPNYDSDRGAAFLVFGPAG